MANKSANPSFSKKEKSYYKTVIIICSIILPLSLLLGIAGGSGFFLGIGIGALAVIIRSALQYLVWEEVDKKETKKLKRIQAYNNMKYCRTCGKLLSGDKSICMKCGCKPLAYKKYCQQCGAKTNDNMKICIKCKSELLR